MLRKTKTAVQLLLSLFCNTKDFYRCGYTRSTEIIQSDESKKFDYLCMQFPVPQEHNHVIQ